ncbi:hypothetical protein BSIN_3427 [Burkholderia singularis]|uniref:Uncharacterized protein n=1 Tax=Burkholderia singularis TaxID=1503053 RepID=A0A238H5I0_9BURK|nr:hypothetical protein BSIN_3427 [Burkholderia singularis]
MVVIFGTVSGVEIVSLASGHMPRRTPLTAACDLVLNIIFLVWAVVLLKEIA